jgi:hypothetical protein
MSAVKRIVKHVEGFEFWLAVLNKRLPYSQEPEAYSVIAKDEAYGFFYSSDVLPGNFKEFNEQFIEQFNADDSNIALELSADGETLTLKFQHHTIVLRCRSSNWCETNVRQVKQALNEYDLDKLRYEYLTTINIFNQVIYEKVIQK